jgi:hypothetical protein
MGEDDDQSKVHWVAWENLLVLKVKVWGSKTCDC